MILLTCSIACGGVARGRLDRADLGRDFFGRLGGLAGEVFHFRCDDRKAAAGFAGARGLDGGIEREQVGLPGDRLNEPDDLADAGGGGRKLRHGLDGALRLGDGAACDLGRGRGLTGDLADRRREFFGRACRRGDVHRGGADALLGRARLRRDRVRRAIERRTRPFPAARRRRAPSPAPDRRFPRNARRSRRSFRRGARARARISPASRRAVRARPRCRGTRSRCAPWRRSRPWRRSPGYPPCCRRRRAFPSRRRGAPSGPVMLRPISQLKMSPRPTTAMPMPMISSLVCCLRGRDALGGGRRLAPGRRDDLVGGGQHLARLGGDDGDARAKSCPCWRSSWRTPRYRTSPDR